MFPTWRFNFLFESAYGSEFPSSFAATSVKAAQKPHVTSSTILIYVCGIQLSQTW